MYKPSYNRALNEGKISGLEQARGFVERTERSVIMISRNINYTPVEISVLYKLCM